MRSGNNSKAVPGQKGRITKLHKADAFFPWKSLPKAFGKLKDLKLIEITHIWDNGTFACICESPINPDKTISLYMAYIEGATIGQ